jgi:hypothetical protein
MQEIPQRETKPLAALALCGDQALSIELRSITARPTLCMPATGLYSDTRVAAPNFVPP